MIYHQTALGSKRISSSVDRVQKQYVDYISLLWPWLHQPSKSLTLKIATQSFSMTLQLRVLYCHTKFEQKRFTGSEDQQTWTATLWPQQWMQPFHWLPHTHGASPTHSSPQCALIDTGPQGYVLQKLLSPPSHGNFSVYGCRRCWHTPPDQDSQSKPHAETRGWIPNP